AATDASPLTVPPITNIGNEFSQLAKKVEESVVAIKVEVPPSAKEEGAGRGDLFRRFAPGQPTPPGEDEEDGDDDPDGGTRQAEGTGFLVDKNGYIITNNHVVEDGSKITVTL